MDNNIDDERKFLKRTAELWNDFIKLETQHPDEKRDFADGIHKLQSILGLRILRKEHPEIFPIKK